MKQTLAGYRIYEQAKTPFMHPMLFGRSLSNERSEGDEMTLEPLLISFESASELLGISRALLYQMHADGRLGVQIHKLGRRSLLNRKELEQWTDAGMPSRIQWEKIRGTL